MKISANAPMVMSPSSPVRRLSSYGLRVIFDSDIMYISYNLDRTYDRRRVISFKHHV